MQYVIPQTMQAVVMKGLGDASVLKVTHIDTPMPGPDEVLIKVHASTVNRFDIFHRSGQTGLPEDRPHILGMDVAGEIVAIGDKVREWEIGERVTASFEALGRDRNGGYAEYTTIPVSELRRLPPGLDTRTAAAIGMAFSTAWVALLYRARIRRREHIVIHAASSGVGTACIQIANRHEGHVIAITSREKMDRVSEVGGHVVLRRNARDLVERVMDATDGQGASLVVDLVGKDTLQSSIEMLAYGGRVVSVGTLSGDKAKINVEDLIMKNASIVGAFQPIRRETFYVVMQLFEDGTFEPIIDATYPLSQAREAHERIESGESFGKIMLIPDALFTDSLHE
ncbi:MAG: zinc-binding dehydrogenase [Chloroflexi bacterium]|nr:zinc-binding dehydrogenase [Chloroflexota bacterium]